MSSKATDLTLAELVVDHHRLTTEVKILRGLLAELIDIEGPQPGNVAWYRKVQAVLHPNELNKDAKK